MRFSYINVLNINNITNNSMTLTDDKITDIFYLIDDFCQEFDKSIQKHLLGNKPKRKPTMSCSEVITLMVMFHSGGYRNMKHFYLNYVQKHLAHLFPHTVSYIRFVELMQAATLPMTIFLKTCCLGKGTGISFIDSTPIRVCKNKRIKRNKVFEGLAKVGKSTMGYFFGFKLHIVINDKGELLNFAITQGHVDDREPLKNKNFIKALKGKLYADKGCLFHLKSIPGFQFKSIPLLFNYQEQERKGVPLFN